MTLMTLAPVNADLGSNCAGPRLPWTPNHAEYTTEIGGSRIGMGMPLSALQAEDLMDRDGLVTVTVHLDQDTYLDHVISSAAGGLTPEDYAHGAAFNFGQPREGSARIIGVIGAEFVVSYTTFVREYLDD